MMSLSLFVTITSQPQQQVLHICISELTEKAKTSSGSEIFLFRCQKQAQSRKIHTFYPGEFSTFRTEREPHCEECHFPGAFQLLVSFMHSEQIFFNPVRPKVVGASKWQRVHPRMLLFVLL